MGDSNLICINTTAIAFGISTTALVFFFPGEAIYSILLCSVRTYPRVFFADLLNFSKNPQAPKGMEISLAMVAMVAGKCCSTRWVEGEVEYTLTW